MKILVTGATGYIGKRLIPLLLEEGHTVYAFARNKERIEEKNVLPLEGDFSLGPLPLPDDIDVAYYFIHSMAQKEGSFEKTDAEIARNFITSIEETNCKQIIYLTGLISDKVLSKHLASRHEVETLLSHSKIPLTALRAGIIIGSGSASYEIIRDLVEKLPIMIAPKWVSNLCQPIAIYDVIGYLIAACGKKECFRRTFDIGGPDVLTYKELLLRYAAKRKLRRFILSVPFFTPRLSSYWLFLITSTSFPLARALVDSLKNNAVCKEFSIHEVIPRTCLTFNESIERTLAAIEENAVISSWHDSWNGRLLPSEYAHYVTVPTHGCYHYTVAKPTSASRETLANHLFAIGGKKGWYSMNWAWRLRGLIDRVLGGVGLRRGKTAKKRLHSGDALDFWRVLLADETNVRLLLYAEMKLPGEAWLEFSLEKNEDGYVLRETATFRPSGLLGRLYWLAMYPFHLIIFPGMLKKILRSAEKKE